MGKDKGTLKQIDKSEACTKMTWESTHASQNDQHVKELYKGITLYGICNINRSLQQRRTIGHVFSDIYRTQILANFLRLSSTSLETLVLSILLISSLTIKVPSL